MAKNTVLALIVMAKTVIMTMAVCPGHANPSNNTRIGWPGFFETQAGKFSRVRTFQAKQI